MRAEIAVLPGDGIGPEVIDAALDVLHAVAKRHGHQFVEQRCHDGASCACQAPSPRLWAVV